MYLNDDFHHNGPFRLSYGFEYVVLAVFRTPPADPAAPT
jgi:hypothetical protein